MGALVGCGLPPIGSSVIARAWVSDIVSGGFSTMAENFPVASGQNVVAGMGLPLFLEISHNCRTRLSPGLGIFGSFDESMIFFDFGSLQIMASCACTLAA